MSHQGQTTLSDHPPGSSSRLARGLARLLAPAIGAVAVVTVAILLSGGLGLSVAILGVVTVAFAVVMPGSSVAVGAPIAMVMAGGCLAAMADQLSIPAAAGLGILILGYLVTVQLAEAADNPRSMTGSALTGWLTGVVGLLGAGVGGAAIVAVAVAAVPVGAGPWLAFAGPLGLFVAVLLAAGRLRARARG